MGAGTVTFTAMDELRPVPVESLTVHTYTPLYDELTEVNIRVSDIEAFGAS